jgi:hypothetical protein
MMETLDSGLVLPPGVRSERVRPVDPPAPWRGGEQMESVALPTWWLALRDHVRRSGGELERYRRWVKRGV